MSFFNLTLSFFVLSPHLSISMAPSFHWNAPIFFFLLLIFFFNLHFPPRLHLKSSSYLSAIRWFKIYEYNWTQSSLQKRKPEGVKNKAAHLEAYFSHVSKSRTSQLEFRLLQPSLLTFSALYDLWQMNLYDRFFVSHNWVKFWACFWSLIIGWLSNCRNFSSIEDITCVESIENIKGFKLYLCGLFLWLIDVGGRRSGKTQTLRDCDLMCPLKLCSHSNCR